MKIKSKLPFVAVDSSTGALTSVACGEVIEIDSTPGAALIEAGLAEAYTLITPTGTKTITANGEDIDVAQYAKVTVNVSTGEASTGDTVG